MALSDMMSKKIAGVPVVYLAGAFVAILAIVAWKMQASSTPEPPVDAAGPEDEYDPGEGGVGEGAYGGLATNGTVIVQPQSPVAEVSEKDTNDKWAKEALARGIKDNMASPQLMQSAVTKYLNGEDMSFAEGEFKDAIIVKVGFPPEPLGSVGTIGDKPAVVVNDPPGERQGTPPLTHTVRGSKDNGTSSLAQLYYGRNDAQAGRVIWAANPQFGRGGPYPVGTKIVIPKWDTIENWYVTPGTMTAAQVGAKNGKSAQTIEIYNLGTNFPVKKGTRVRVD